MDILTPGTSARIGTAARLVLVSSDSPRFRLGVEAPPRQWRRTLGQLEALENELAASRQRALAAQSQVEILTMANAQLLAVARKREFEVATMRHNACHDALTGLPNRALLLDRLGQAMARADRQQHQLALLFLDLDQFKDVNDRLGHAAGDALLQRVAAHLLSSIRSSDTACRYGGDEFVLLLPDVDSEQRALDVARQIRVRLARPYRLDDQSITVTASIGIAVFPADGSCKDELIAQADIAMYRAKALHRRISAPDGTLAAR